MLLRSERSGMWFALFACAMATMYSRVKVSGHPIHPMLVAFPVTFYTTTLIGFAAYAITQSLFWWQVGLWSNLAGVATAVLAAVPGTIDWATGIPRGSAARALGLKHMLLNLSALFLFSLNLALQRNTWSVVGNVANLQGRVLSDMALLTADASASPGMAVALVLSATGFLVTLLAGFLGFSLVQVHHVGVELTDEQRRLETKLPPAPRRSLVQS